MAQIVFTGIEGWEEPYLQEKFPGHQLTFIRRPLQQQDWPGLARTEILSPFSYPAVNSEVLDKLPNLKFIATRSTEFDHIDVEVCHERKIKVANVPYYGENTVAEHTWALILALSRKIFQSYERTERGNFQIDQSLRGFDLAGKILGIIGCGHIGQHVVRIARAFAMKVLVF